MGTDARGGRPRGSSRLRMRREGNAAFRQKKWKRVRESRDHGDRHHGAAPLWRIIYRQDLGYGGGRVWNYLRGDIAVPDPWFLKGIKDHEPHGGRGKSHALRKRAGTGKTGSGSVHERTEKRRGEFRNRQRCGRIFIWRLLEDRKTGGDADGQRQPGSQRQRGEGHHRGWDRALR